MNRTKKKALLAASVAGLMVVSSLSAAQTAQTATGELERCYGINACKGTGGCSGKGNACAGHNACKGHGFVDVAKDSCAKIQGGRLTA